MPLKKIGKMRRSVRLLNYVFGLASVSKFYYPKPKKKTPSNTSLIHTLRSTGFGTWGHSKSVLQSVLCGSFAGCFVAIVGDTTAPYIKNVEILLRRAGLEAAGEHEDIDNLKVANNAVDNIDGGQKKITVLNPRDRLAIELLLW